jgi:hypothetical protein
MCINIKFSIFIVELQRGEETNKSREIQIFYFFIVSLWF